MRTLSEQKRALINSLAKRPSQIEGLETRVGVSHGTVAAVVRAANGLAKALFLLDRRYRVQVLLAQLAHAFPELTSAVDRVQNIARKVEQLCGSPSAVPHSSAPVSVAKLRAHMELSPNAIVAGRYRLDCRLGQGGMGEVWSATNIATGRSVAVKRLLIPDEGDEAAEARFSREARAACAINHPNIVDVLDLVEEPGKPPWLVMELLQGETLASRLSRDQQLSVTETARLLLPVASAIRAGHARGIFHRDLKPANIFLQTGPGRALVVKVLDFGIAGGNIAADTSPRTQPGTVLGTPGYMAPEQTLGEPGTDHRVDIWSLGVLLYECLSGGRPIEGDNPVQIALRLMESGITPLQVVVPDVDGELAKLVGRMLERDPKKRPADLAEVESLLSRLAGQGEAAETETQRASGAPSSRLPDPAARTRLQLAGNLPPQPTRFVARQSEVRAVLQLLSDQDTRLVTIVATGGMGKTRLALEVAKVFSESESGGIPAYFVALAPLPTPDLIVPAIAEAVGFKFAQEGEAWQQLFDFLRDKQMLLVMDNYEHLLQGAPIIGELLQVGATLKVLVTSRARLSLSAETVFTLGPMTLPPASVPDPSAETGAVALFIESARRSDPSFTPDAADLGQAARICHAVYGVPLAIILAASWVPVLSLAEIADEIEQNVDFLSAEFSDLPERQRSLRAVFDHSLRQVSESEREAFCRLSLFRAGFTREAAVAVAEVKLPALAALANHSLVARSSAEGRYEVHELLRQYGEEKLRASPEAHQRSLDRLVDYYAAFLEDRLPALKAPNIGQVLSEIERELENIRTAWHRMVEQRTLGPLGRAAESLGLFYSLRRPCAEGADVFGLAAEALEAMLEGGAKGARLAGLTLTWQACFVGLQGEDKRAAELLERARSILVESGQEAQLAFTLSEAAATYAGSDHRRALDMANASLALYRKVHDSWGTARALNILAIVHAVAGNLFEVEAAGRESLRVQAEATGAVLFPDTLVLLGSALAQRGRYTEGTALMLDGLSLAEASGDPWSAMACSARITDAHRCCGNYAEAEAWVTRCRELAGELGDSYFQIHSNVILAVVRKEQRRNEDARRYLEIARAQAERVGNEEELALIAFEFGDLAFLSGDLSTARRWFAESLAVFDRLELRWGRALVLLCVGRLECEEGDYDEALRRLRPAAELALGGNLLQFAASILAQIGQVLAETGEPERGVEFLCLADHHFATSLRTRAWEIGPALARLKPRLPSETYLAAMQRGKNADLQQTLERFLTQSDGEAVV